MAGRNVFQLSSRPLNFWRRLASFIVRQESDLSKWNEVNKYRDDALEKFEELVSMDRVPF